MGYKDALNLEFVGLYVYFRLGGNYFHFGKLGTLAFILKFGRISPNFKRDAIPTNKKIKLLNSFTEKSQKKKKKKSFCGTAYDAEVLDIS